MDEVTENQIDDSLDVDLDPVETDVVEPETSEEDVTRIAQEVLAGHWGRGHDRERRLRKAGHNVIAVNLKINELRNR